MCAAQKRPVECGVRYLILSRHTHGWGQVFIIKFTPCHIEASRTADSVGRVLSKAQTVAGITRTVTLTRDSLGRVIGMVYPSGLTVNTTYNGDRVASIVAGGYPLISNISYRPFSNVATGWTWGNGTTYSRSFDGDGRVTQASLGAVTRSYGFDAVGRITTQSDVGPAGSATSNISYDEAGQLTSASGPAGNFSYASI